MPAGRVTKGRSFASGTAFRDWLAEHHASESGRDAFQRREAKRSGIYAYENRQTELSPEYAKTLRANKRAWKFFSGQAPWYQRTSIYWVMSAKKEETRENRLATLIEVSAKGKPLPQLDRTKD